MINERYPFIDMGFRRIHERYVPGITRFVPFFGTYGELGFLSNHYPSPIKTVYESGRTIVFNTVEQRMMYEKAMLFNDLEIAEKILQTDNPISQKKLGRLVKGFKNEIWEKKRNGIVIRACQQKFEQNLGLRAKLKKLLKQSNTVLVEASPFDGIWGVRLPVEAEEIHDPSKWAGENRLGFILTTIGKYINVHDNFVLGVSGSTKQEPEFECDYLNTWSSNAQS